MAKKQEKREQSKKSAKGVTKEKELKTLISPVGIAKWPWITEPDTRFNEDGKYNVTLVLDSANKETKAFIAKLDELAGEKHVPYKRDEDSGDYLVRFSSGFRPRVFDSLNQQLRDVPSIGGGSKIRVAFQPNVYKGFGGGLNLYLKGVQVLTLVEPSAGFEFPEEDGGFTFEGSGGDAKPEKGDDLPY